MWLQMHFASWITPSAVAAALGWVRGSKPLGKATPRRGRSMNVAGMRGQERAFYRSARSITAFVLSPCSFNRPASRDLCTRQRWGLRDQEGVFRLLLLHPLGLAP
jgi:hypothetical protein